MCIYDNISPIFLRMRNISGKFVDKIKTHFMFCNAFSEYRAVYEIMWKNIVNADIPRMST